LIRIRKSSSAPSSPSGIAGPSLSYRSAKNFRKSRSIRKPRPGLRALARVSLLDLVVIVLLLWRFVGEFLGASLLQID
jgi:hypothetical protein